MTPERWQQVEEVLQAVLDQPEPERASFLDQACEGDDDLRRETNSLLSAYDDAGNFIEQPAMAVDAHLLLGDTVGSEVGPYKIIKCLGSGGMGEVYLAQDTRLNRPVALKILPAYFAADDARLRRFQREARTASALNHPNIITIHEVGEHGEVRFIATEFVDGDILRSLIENRSLSVEEILELAIQVASGLSAAHSAGIVHRDIKPENIMRRADGLVKILDFGIAKLVEPESSHISRDTQSETRMQTEVGVVIGTVNYMSPEQARALDVDERTDIWSLGVVLYEMLTNRLPFSGVTRMDTLVNILEREPNPIGGRDLAQLQNVVSKALGKDRNNRYQNAEQLLRDLQMVKEGGNDTQAKHITTRRSSEIVPSRNRAVRLLVLGALIVALLFGGVAIRKYFTRQRNSASINEVARGPYLQMSETEQLAFINAQEQRVSNMMGDRHVPLSDEALRTIKSYVDRFVARGGTSGDLGDASMKAVYTRARSHVPLISRAFAARKVPVIIGIYLPVVESAYRDCYENSNGAKGLFQFLPQTARHYGVAPEEMCDVEKMAPAAAHYIADRMAELGEDSESLTLVLLSYNRGPEMVRDNLRELRDTPNYQRNFWTLFANRDKLDETFRNESAGYVPAFFAAAILGENPQAFDLGMEPLSTLAK